MKKFLVLLVVPILLFSSCASILASKHQQVTINTDPKNEVYIDGEKATPNEKGKYLFERNRKPKQITLKRDGYKSQYITLVQYKKSPLFIMSVIPFGIFLYPIAYDTGAKSSDYDFEVNGTENLLALPEKSLESKKIMLNNFGAKIKQKDFKFNFYFNFKEYKNNHKNKFASDINIEKLDAKNTIFSDIMNDILKEKGYIDTTAVLLKNSFLNNLYIDAMITDVEINSVGMVKHNTNLALGFVCSKLSIEWKALDYYKKEIFSITTTTKSGEFAYYEGNNNEDVILSSFKDAMESGLIEFISKEETQALLHDRSDETREAEFETILIPIKDEFVENLSQSIKSSVTVRGKSGHGSGFMISSEGHIITNYHVISDNENLKVILNNNEEYDVEIIRVSKINDLALLKIERSECLPFKFHVFNRDNIEIAMDIYAVGTPTSEDLSQTVSKGIISGIRDTEKGTLIQTDASINGGNSGGAIVTKTGKVVAVVSSKLNGFGIEGVAFGIPAYIVFDKLKLSYDKQETKVETLPEKIKQK